MKNFIKNSIITLFHSKWILGLLLLFSLFAAALFTSFANANRSHLDKYNSIMQKGVAPDAVIYQEYNYKFGIERIINAEEMGNNVYRFRFSEASAYIKYATQNNPQHYMINPPNENLLFKPYMDNFYWEAQTDNVANYIQEKHNLLVAELQTDSKSRAEGYISDNYSNTKIQEFKSLTIKPGGSKSFEAVEIDKNSEVNKLVYTAGEGNLFNETNNDFFKFNDYFNQTKNALNNNLTETKNYANYISLYKAMLANFPDPGSENANAIENLINYCDGGSPQTKQPNWTLLKNFFNALTVDNAANFFTLSWTVILPYTIVITNPSAFESVISTANVYHGEYHYSPEAYHEWDNFLKNKDNDGKKYNRNVLIAELNLIKQKYPDSFINIDTNTFLIVGEAITPSYIFPILSGSTSINVANQSILFLSDGGYKFIRQSYATAQETILTFVKFPNFSRKQIARVIKQGNAWANEHMNFQGAQSLYFFNDASGWNTLVGMRVNFLPDLNRRVSNIFFAVSAVMWLITFILIFFIIRIIVNKNRNVISIFNANGLRMIKLVTSFSMLIVLPIVIGYIFGFIVSIFSQRFVDSFLNKYWVTVETNTVADWKLFLISFVIFSAIVIVGSLIVGYTITRKNLTLSMKKDDVSNNSYLALTVKKMFFFSTIMTRMRISIIFSSLWKMILLAILMAVYASFVSFFLATLGKFDQARFYTQEENNYAYAVSLTTPTTQSGPIHYIDDYTLGQTADGFANQSNYLTSLAKWENLEFVSAKTIDSYQNDVLFLNDAVGAKITLDYYLGNKDYVGVNIWNLASGIMPTGQLISSNNDYNKLVEYLYSTADNQPNKDNGEGKYISKSADGQYIFTDNCFSQVAGFKIGINNAFATFLLNNFFSQQKELAKDNIFSYYLNYGIIGLNKQVIGGNKFCDDVTNKTPKYKAPKYAFLEMDSTDNDLSVYGIQNNDPSDADYLGPQLVLENGTIINDQLSLPTVDSGQQPGVYDVIVNKAFAALKKLKVGSTFKMTFTNFADRIYAQKKSEDKSLSQEEPGVMKYLDDEITFKVKNISRGAKIPRAYINFDDANKILGFKDIDKDNNESSYYFNGFFSPANDNLNFLKHSVTLFSTSGLYPGCSTFDESAFWNMIKTTIVDNDKTNPSPQIKQLARALNMNYSDLKDDDQSINNYVNILVNHYKYPYFSIVSNLESTEANMQIFDTTASAINGILMFALGMLVIMVSVIIVIMSFLTIDNLRKIGIRLQILGYNKIEVLASLLSVCIPTFLIGVLVAQPLLWLIMKFFAGYIFRLTKIVLVMKMSFLISLVGALAVLLMLAIAFWLGYYFLSKTNNLINDTKSF